MTGVGVLLGTAANMSPEQAKGFAADHRSDIFSFGCVLYETLTVRQPFQGETAPEVLASVLVREADFTALPPNLNPRLTEPLRRCLDKHPKRRWQAIGDLRVEVNVIGAAPHGDRVAVPIAPSDLLWRRFALFSVPAIAFTAAIASAAWFVTRPLPPHVSRLNITTPAASAWSRIGNDRDLTITPDGSRIVMSVPAGSFCTGARHARSHAHLQGDAPWALHLPRRTADRIGG